MRFHFTVAGAAVATFAALTIGVSVDAAVDGAASVAPVVAASPTPPGDVLPTIGRTHAVTTFCRRIVDDGSALATDQIDDIATTTEALRILAFTPFDRDPFVQRRAALALEVLSARLMTSRRGAAKTYVADLRRAARGVAAEVPIDVKHLDAIPFESAHADLARFAAALDGAHAESSHVAHEISRAVSILGETDYAARSMYLPDREMYADPRFARALTPTPFPVDANLDRRLNQGVVENGPLHRFARAMAIDISESLERMLGSVGEARELFPTAYVGCTAVDDRPSAAPSVAAPTATPSAATP